jgi:hypothetical protein
LLLVTGAARLTAGVFGWPAGDRQQYKSQKKQVGANSIFGIHE